jgi:hypothetical protein
MADFPILFFMVAPQGSVKVSVMFSALMKSRFVTRDKGIEIGGAIVGFSSGK